MRLNQRLFKSMRLQSILFIISIAYLVIASVSVAVTAKDTPELREKGKATYTTNCAICHGEKGDGNGAAGAMLNPKPRNFAKDKLKQGSKPDQIFKTITEGVPNTPMVGYGHLSEQDRWGLTYYVLSFRKVKK